MSDYLEQKLLDQLFNKVAFVGPSTYAALFTTGISFGHFLDNKLLDQLFG